MTRLLSLSLRRASICLSRICVFNAVVENQVEDSRGISFVDDVTWVVEGTDLDDVVDKLERCAAASLPWQRSALRNIKDRDNPLPAKEEAPPR